MKELVKHFMLFRVHSFMNKVSDKVSHESLNYITQNQLESCENISKQLGKRLNRQVKEKVNQINE